MSVYRRAGSPFFWYSFSVGGRRFRGSTGRKTKREAEEVERDERHLAKQGIGSGKEWTLLAVLNCYWSEHAKFKRSAAMIETHLAELQAGLGGGTLASRITPGALIDYRARRRGASKRLKDHSVNRDFAYLRAALEHCRQHGAQMPPVNWKKLKAAEPPGRIRFLDEDEYDRLMAAAHPSLRPIILCAVTTGLRRGDIMRLEWRQVKLAERIIQIQRTKANRAHQVRIAPALMAALSTIPAEKRRGRVFDLTGFRRRWEKAVDAAELDNFRFHDLRHTFASWARMAGADLAEIMEALDHSTINMTMRYAHIKPNAQITAFDRVSATVLSRNVAQEEAKSLAGNGKHND
jgi:integrase